MKSGKKVYVVHAGDAGQHLGNCKQILDTLQKEKRCAEVISLEAGQVDQDSFSDIGTKDAVIILLTDGIAEKKAEIEEIVLRAKTREPGIKTIEVLIDNLTFEPQFMALPRSLEPIRASEDMDAKWQEVEEVLKKLSPKPLVKWWIYALGILALGTLVYFIGPKLFSGKAPLPEFTYRVLDPVKGDVISNAEACYLPCRLFLNDRSKNADKIEWRLGDTTIVDEAEPEYVIENAGEFTIQLVASKGNKQQDTVKSIMIKAPPIADFDIKENGCTAPCDITFEDRSKDAPNVKWEFLDGTTPTTAGNESEVIRRYATHGEFSVRLEAENADGILADTIQKVTILEDQSPYADFGAKKTTGGYSNKQTFKFTNRSKNGKTYVWNFGDGSNPHPSTTTNSVTHEFIGYGTYAVSLRVIAADGTTAESVKPVYVRDRRYVMSRAHTIDVVREVYHVQPID